jgi:hypothetical protein
MSVAAAEAAVPVNGKVSLGTRRLVVSHVENAASFFAYQEAQAGYMKEIAEACRDQCSAGLTPLNHPPTLHQVSLAADLRIRDVYPSRIRIFPSRIRMKKFKYFNPKKWFLSSMKYDPGCSSRIRIRNTVLPYLV